MGDYLDHLESDHVRSLKELCAKKVGDLISVIKCKEVACVHCLLLSPFSQLLQLIIPFCSVSFLQDIVWIISPLEEISGSQE